MTPFYDPLLAKLCVYGPDRDEALRRARDAVASFRITGLKTNLPFHADLLDSEEFSDGGYDTSGGQPAASLSRVPAQWGRGRPAAAR